MKGKSPNKVSACASSNTHASSNAHAHISTHANHSTYIEEIDHDSSYPMLDRIVFRSIDVFKMDDALLNMMGERSEFKSFHPKRQGKVFYHPYGGCLFQRGDRGYNKFFPATLAYLLISFYGEG